MYTHVGDPPARSDEACAQLEGLSDPHRFNRHVRTTQPVHLADHRLGVLAACC